MTTDDKAALFALMHWFQSQDISPGRSLEVMSLFIGFLVAERAKDLTDLEQVLSLFHEMLRSMAFNSFARLNQ